MAADRHRASQPRPPSRPSQTAFDRLVKSGCHPHILKTLIEWSEACRTPEKLFGGRERLSSVDVRSLADDLGAVRNRVRRFGESVDGMLETPVLLSGTSVFHELVPLLDQAEQALTDIADRRDKSPSENVSNAALAQLVVYVNEITGRAHDPEVGELVGKSPAGMLQWRTRNRALLQQCRAANVRSIRQPL
jgi:hypothetical protein